MASGKKMPSRTFVTDLSDGRQAAQEEQSRIDADRAAFHEDMKRATLLRRAGFGRVRVGPSPAEVAAERMQQLKSNLQVDAIAAQAQAQRNNPEMQAAPVEPNQTELQSKGPYRVQ